MRCKDLRCTCLHGQSDSFSASPSTHLSKNLTRARTGWEDARRWHFR